MATLVDTLNKKNEELLKFYGQYLFPNQLSNASEKFEKALIHLKGILEDCEKLETALTDDSAVCRRNEEFKETVRQISEVLGTELKIAEEPRAEKPVTKKSPEAKLPSEVTDVMIESTEDGVKGHSKALIVTTKEFAIIPKYLLGRFTLNDLNEFTSKIDEFTAYVDEISKKPRNNMTKKELDFVDNRRPLVSKAGTDRFFLEDDLKPLLPPKLSPFTRKIIPCLRHIKKIKQTRVGSQTLYFAAHVF